MSLLAKFVSQSVRLSATSRLNYRSFSTTVRLCREHDHGSTQKADYAAKYAEKLQRRAEDQGVSVEQLQQQIKEKAKKEREVRRSKLERMSPAKDRAYASADALAEENENDDATADTPLSVPFARRDSSPVKPLSNILNLDRLLQTPHTPEQVSLLWRAYHASRSEGTGRGYLCATVPVATYQKMLDVASRYPAFVVPVPRENAQIAEQEQKDAQPTEFFFLEWGFHGPPLELRASDDLFAPPRPSSNPQTSTVLFTPLQEYKIRASFATPYLVITHYTDLADSHGLVLLRGEITPSAADAQAVNGDGRYLLSQQDAQLLTMAVQKFYLWGDGQNERGELLRRFYERPEEFRWEDLLEHSGVST